MYLKVMLKRLKGNEIVTEVIRKNTMELEDYYHEIDCRTIEITSLNEDVAIVSDEEALMVSGNPVFSIGDLNIPGTFIIGKNVMTDNGIKVQGFDNLEDVKNSLGLTVIEIIGKTA